MSSVPRIGVLSYRLASISDGMASTGNSAPTGPADSSARGVWLPGFIRAEKWGELDFSNESIGTFLRRRQKKTPIRINMSVPPPMEAPMAADAPTERPVELDVEEDVADGADVVADVGVLFGRETIELVAVVYG